MRILTILLALIIAAGATVAPVDAQKADRKEKVKKKLRAMRAAILVDELDLDEKTATKLMPILNDYDDDFAKLAKENLELREQLDSTTDEKDLDAVIDDLVENQRARWDLDEARFKEVRKVLTARQAAKIIVLLPEIDRKILQGAKKAVKAKKRKGKKARTDGTVKDPFAVP